MCIKSIEFVSIFAFLFSFFFLDIPTENGNSVNSVHQNGDSLDTNTSDESNQGPLNGKNVIDEDTTTSFTEDSLDKPSTPIVANEETNDSIVSDSTNDSTTDFNKRPLDDDSNSEDQQPSSKKLKDDVGDK